ncbi:MAG: DNA mismatch repair protein MutS, partial [Candidatus Latescibacterota bacterium]
AYPRLFNLKITIKEWEGGIIFLRKIAPGTSDKSYGIHAARIAGLPAVVLKRAEEILHSLELRRDLLRQGVDLKKKMPQQYGLFSTRPASAQAADPTADAALYSVIQDIRLLDVESTTPLEALQALKKLKEKLEGN